MFSREKLQDLTFQCAVYSRGIEACWWVEAVALALPPFRKLRTSSRSEKKTHGNRISQQSSGEVAIAMPLPCSLHLFS